MDAPRCLQPSTLASRAEESALLPPREPRLRPTVQILPPGSDGEEMSRLNDGRLVTLVIGPVR